MDELLDSLERALLAGGQRPSPRGGPSTQLAVERTLHQAGLDPSRDLVRWFQWASAKGASVEVMPGWSPTNAGESVLRWRESVRMEAECAAGTTLSVRWPSHLLLLQDSIGHRDTVAVAEGGRGHVMFFAPEYDPAPMFDSVRSMVRTLTTCWKGGGYVMDDSYAAVNNPHVVAKAWRSENPRLAARHEVPPEVLAGEPLDAYPPRPSRVRVWLQRLVGASKHDQRRARELLDVVEHARGDGVDRRSALAQLAEHFPDQARQVLPVALEDPELRGSAVVRMAELGDPGVVPTAVAMLNPAGGPDVTEAIRALGIAGDRSVVPLLCGIVSSGTTSEKDAAIAALNRIGDSSAIPVLRQQLTSEHLGTRTLAEIALRGLEDASRHSH